MSAGDDERLEREARERFDRGFEATLAASREPFGKWWDDLRAAACCAPRRYAGPGGVKLRHVKGCREGKRGTPV